MEVRKANGFLKVVGILMIIGGSIALIVSIIAMAGVAVLAAAGLNSALLTVGAVISLIGAVVEFVAGILGVVNAAKPEKANTCIACGICCAALAVIGCIFTMIAGGAFPVISLIFGLVLPVLYLIGAFQSKKMAA